MTVNGTSRPISPAPPARAPPPPAAQEGTRLLHLLGGPLSPFPPHHQALVIAPLPTYLVIQTHTHLTFVGFF